MASVVKRETTTGPRYDVRYRLPSGQVRTKTVRTVREARSFAAQVEADKSRGGVIDPRAGRLILADYAKGWIADRPDLRPRTVELYNSLYRLHIGPKLGKVELGKLDSATIRAWNASLIRADVGATTTAKAYRLLRAILNTAVEDRRIIANPCQIKKAGAEHPTERPVATPAQVLALADAVPAERRCMILLAGFCGLRLGEVLGLAARHIDLLHNTMTVERQLQEIGRRGEQVFSAPKSAKGVRTIPLPASVAAELLGHLQRHPMTGPDSLLFTGDKGGPLRRGVWNGEWDKARKKVGLPTLRYHDLRHSALTLMAATGATIAELQAHAGHASPDAAMRYQHATTARAATLAALVEKVIEASGDQARVVVQSIR